MEFDFTLEDVKNFMLERGGRCRNHELVSHFKKSLSDPDTKVAAREAFKDIVNTLSTVKQTASGEKIMVLKRKFMNHASKIKPEDAESVEVDESIEQGLTDNKLNTVSSPINFPSEIDVGSSEIVNENTQKFSIGEESDIAECDTSLKTLETTITAAEPSSTETLSEAKLVQHDTREFKKISDPTECKDLSEKQMVDNISMDSMTSSVTTASTSSSKEGSREPTLPEQSHSADSEENFEARKTKISVKEKAKKINKQSDIDTGNTEQEENHDDDSDVHYSHVSLSPEERNFLLAIASADYEKVSGMLLENAELASFRDFFSGYTALHHAARRGRKDLIKLLAGKYSCNVNQRTGGGYTPVHLAAINGHEECIELLRKGYGANLHLRDYSGKMPEHYLRNKEALSSFYANRKQTFGNLLNSSSDKRLTINANIRQ